MNKFTEYTALASETAGLGCLVIGVLLTIKAFFVDALSSYGFGFFGILISAVGVGLFMWGKSLTKPKT